MQMKSGKRSIGMWELGQQVGIGSFAVVWFARNPQTGQEAAVKEIALRRLNSKLLQVPFYCTLIITRALWRAPCGTLMSRASPGRTSTPEDNILIWVTHRVKSAILSL